jgi:uncharacterized protein YbjT (DUF2867 family)
MIAVIGATGHTGKVVVDQLLDRGERVRAIARSADKLQPLVARGAEAAAGDITDAAFLTNAFRGADAAYVMVPPDYQAADYFGRYARITDSIARAIEQTGVPAVVFLSSIGGDQPDGTGPIVGLHRSEARLRQIPNVNLLILRPGFFYENVFGNLPIIQHTGVNGGAFAPDVAMPAIASHDIGVAAAEALLARNFTGATVRELHGPRDLTWRELTTILGQKIGKPDLQYVQFPDEDVVKGLVQAGFTEQLGRLFVEMAHGFNTRHAKPIEGRTPANTGPTTFEEFAADTLAPAYHTMARTA